ncbi:DUF4190 domain-containing protein [Pseudactinotalea terrae]|uniref:DUF4190 domain-containing protein n=1 Tax=Pseudactinotalea terrae TaxID=1743262 RepID=UPI0012E2294D|nr:DUF4190 domain-containing protein [Pseudactinotalea terrae]
MSYGPPPPPSGGTNPYGEVPEGGSSSTPSVPSYGTPPSGPAGSQLWQTPQDAPPPPPPPPSGPSYGTPPAQQYGGPAQNYSPYLAQSRYPGAPGYGGWINSTRDNGKATGALVMGILSIVLCFGSLLGIGLGVGAILMGNAGRRAADAGTADNRGVATAGLVLGCIGVGMSLLASLGYLSQFAAG